MINNDHTQYVNQALVDAGFEPGSMLDLTPVQQSAVLMRAARYQRVDALRAENGLTVAR